MWVDYIENSKILYHLFKHTIPNLDNVLLMGIDIDTNIVSNIRIKVDILDLPSELPDKWKQKGYNSVQLHLNCVSCSSIVLNIDKINKKGIITLQRKHNKEITIRFVSNSKEVISIETQIIDISVIGYIHEER